MACTFDKLDTCAKCMTGYYLKSGTCKICEGNCLSCLGKGACVKCMEGF